MNLEMRLTPDEIQSLATQSIAQSLAYCDRETDGSEILTVATLSKYLKVRPSWIYRQVHCKSIPFSRLGKYLRFRKSTIDRWVNTQGVPFWEL